MDGLGVLVYNQHDPTPKRSILSQLWVKAVQQDLCPSAAFWRRVHKRTDSQSSISVFNAVCDISHGHMKTPSNLHNRGMSIGMPPIMSVNVDAKRTCEIGRKHVPHPLHLW